MNDESPYAVIVVRILDQIEPEEGDNDPPPSDADIVATLRLLTAVYRQTPELIPRAAASSFEGRVYLYWRKADTALHLGIYQGKTQLYRRHGKDSYLFEHAVTPELLTKALRWYANPTVLVT